jgi:putative N6-adenine-specific DNA methylase
MSKIQLIATATFGLEAIVARELNDLGYEDHYVEDGKVIFTGDESDICLTNLWLRTADRVFVRVGEFKALTFEELFEQTKALPWDEWIPPDAEFPVNGKSIRSKLFSVSDCQAIVKKAIVEKLKLKYKKNWFEEKGPKYTIEVALLKDMATLTIDTSGPGLHKRGYRPLVGEASLKETLASGMILVSRWTHDRALLDPCCGSGTIPIESAMIGLNMAPGLKREFASEHWVRVPKKLWINAREEAKSFIKPDRELRIQGSDIDEKALNLARYHAKQAGVEKYVHFQKRPLNEISSRFKYGFIITNPPYGERQGDEEYVENLYREMGKAFEKFDSWSYYVITSYPGFERLFGQRADKKRKLYNGKIQCNYYQYFGPKMPLKAVTKEDSQ